MSGPGPFKGWGFSAPFLCYGVPRLSDTYKLQPDWDCDTAKTDKTRVVIDFEALYLKSEANKLVYPSTVSGVPRVTLFMVVPSINLRVHRMLSVGSGFGFARFSTNAVDKTLLRGVFQPVRVTIRPLAAFADGVEGERNKRLLEIFQIHVAATIFSPGFDAKDFGAVDGTFDAPYEVQWSTKLVVDFWKFLPR